MFCHKKARNNEQRMDLNMVFSSSLSALESQQLSISARASCHEDQTTTDPISDTSSSPHANSVGLNESFDAKSISSDINKSCFDSPV
jgi:hypothetical protein